FHFRSGPLQPKPHIHVAVHRRRRSEMLPRSPVLAPAPMKLAETKMTVGDQRAHPELSGNAEGCSVVARSLRVDWRNRCQVAENMKDVRLAAASSRLT